MSSLFSGIRFSGQIQCNVDKQDGVIASRKRHVEDVLDQKKKQSFKGKKKKSHKKKRKRNSKDGHNSSSSEDEELFNADTKGQKQTDLSQQPLTAPPQMIREAWMTTPMTSSRVVETKTSVEDLRHEEEEKIKQHEIEAGIREPSTGLLYGLYDPKQSKAAVNSSCESYNQELTPTPRAFIGDGGASWRAKMLKRAQERAAETGETLEKVIADRFGAVDDLRNAAANAARSDAHLYVKRDIVETTDEKQSLRSLPVGKDAGEKLIISRYAGRLQDAIEVSYGKKEGKDTFAEHGIDYSSLPDFDDPQFTRKKKRQGDLASRGDRTNRGHQQDSASMSNERRMNETRGRRVDEFGRACQPKPSRSSRSSESVAEAALTRRSTDVGSHSNQHPSSDGNNNRSKFLYDGQSSRLAKTSTESSKVSQPPPSAATHEEDATDLNKLAAQAMRAKLLGNVSLHDELLQKLQDKEKKAQSDRNTIIVSPPFDFQTSSISTSTTHGSMGDGNLRFNSKRVERKGRSSTTIEQQIPLEELVRREKLEGSRTSHLSSSRLDEVHARNVMRLGTHYKGTELGGSSMSGFDEEDQVDTKMYETPTSRLTACKQEERIKSRAVSDAMTWDRVLQKCLYCMKSERFKKHLMISLGDHSYLALPSRAMLDEKHCIIVPINHTTSLTRCDEEVLEEVHRFKSSVRNMFNSIGQDVIFMEKTERDDLRRHTVIECVPVPRDVEADTPMFFKQAILEVDEEWSTHKKIIDTFEKGLVRSIPASFPYFHVEWSKGGYAHIIEDEAKFPKDFGIDVIAGMLEVDPVKYNRHRPTFDEERKKVLTFLDCWKEFDWTSELE